MGLSPPPCPSSFTLKKILLSWQRNKRKETLEDLIGNTASKKKGPSSKE
jgi:hypothetical protein